MFNQIKTTLVSILLPALAFGGFSVALAASTPASNGASPASVLSAAPAAVLPGDSPAPNPAITGATWAMGRVSAIAADNFTLTGPLGGAHVVYVNDQTQYFNRGAQAGSFAAMQVGDRVLGAAAVAGGQATAKLVIDLGPRTHYHGRGVSSTVNGADQSFTLVNRRGVVRTFYVDADTRITDKNGLAKTFAAIQPGTRLFVRAEKRADGQWWAVAIRLGNAAPVPAATSINS